MSLFEYKDKYGKDWAKVPNILCILIQYVTGTRPIVIFWWGSSCGCLVYVCVEDPYRELAMVQAQCIRSKGF